MIQHLDDDSLIYMLHFMELSDIVENLALVNTKCFNFVNIENDHQGAITNLLIEKLFFSEDINLAQLLFRLEKVLCLDSIMSDSEKQIINYDILKSIFISSSEEENFINQFEKHWRKIFRIETYAKLKVCMDFGKRLGYLDLFCLKKDVPQPRLTRHEFELFFRVDLEEYTETNTIYKEFQTLAKDYELSHDKIYKFRLIHNNKQLQVAKYFSKKREIEREKDILLKYYTYVYNYHTQTNEFQYTPPGGELDILVLSHQESVENNVLLSTWNLQSSETYRLSSYTTQRGEVFLPYLSKANQFFHSFTNPFKCGDLRYSKKRDVHLWTISRKEIKNLTTPYLIYPLLPLPLMMYIASKYTSDKPIGNYLGHFLFLIFCDAVVVALISLLSVDQLCNRFRKMDGKDFKLFSAISCGLMVLKASVSYLNSPTPFHTFMSSFQYSLPAYTVLMPYFYGSLEYFKLLFWYIRSTDWFYQHVAIPQENIIFKGLRKCFDWITNYFSLKSVDNDSPTRCAIN